MTKVWKILRYPDHEVSESPKLGKLVNMTKTWHSRFGVGEHEPLLPWFSV